MDDDLLVISGPITLGEHRIAFTRYGYSDLEVLIVDVDGGNERPLTDQVGSSDPVWSPDGTRIAFTGKRYGFYGYSEIYLVDADGGNLEQLTSHHSDLEPVWSPDGTRIAFISDGCIFLIDTDGENLRLLTGGPEELPPERCGQSGPVWSPDGNRIAFLLRTSDGTQLFVTDMDGAHPEQLVDTVFSNKTRLMWSRDGISISINSEGLRYIVEAARFCGERGLRSLVKG